MNIDELEKLARAAQQDSESQARIEFLKIAANPSAILELISEYKNAIRLLSIANNGLSGSHTIAWQAQTKVAIARANGEINDE